MADAVDRDALILEAMHLQAQFNELLQKLEKAGVDVAVIDPPWRHNIDGTERHPGDMLLISRVVLNLRIKHSLML